MVEIDYDPDYAINIWTDIEGHLSLNECVFLSMLSYSYQHGKALEIGAFKGKSACLLGRHCSILSIDPFVNTYMIGDESVYEEYITNVNKHVKRFKVLKMTSDTAINYINSRFDIIFIDGDHSEEAVNSDIINYYPLLNENGIILFHDFLNPHWLGVKRAYNMHANKFRYYGNIDNMRWCIK